MRAVLWILFVFLNARHISSHQVTKTLPLVDAVLSTLEKETWNDDQACLQETLELLKGVQNNTLWAVSRQTIELGTHLDLTSFVVEVNYQIIVWDSMQLPMGIFHGVRVHLGHFEQCLMPPAPHPQYRQQYCIVEVRGGLVGGRREFDAFDDAHEFYKYPNKFNRYHNIQEVGVCLPAVCTPTSITKIYRHILSFTNLPDGEVVVDHRDCQTGSVAYSSKFYLFWCVVGILVTTAILSTHLNKNIYDGKNPCYSLITKSFCLKRNLNGLFESNKNELYSLNGVRFFTAFFVVLIHDGYYSMQNPLVNARGLDELTTTNIGKFVMQTSYLVDTFFTMSGLLLMRNLITSKSNLLVNLLKRYLRLIGPFGLAIFYINTAVINMDSGPYWTRANRVETEVCQEYWWKSLLMLNNRPDTACHIVTWHMASDYQLSIIVTVIYYLYTKNKKIGLSAFGVIGVAMSLYLGYDVYRKELPYMSFETASAASQSTENPSAPLSDGRVPRMLTALPRWMSILKLLAVLKFLCPITHFFRIRVNTRKDTSILYHHFLTHCHSAPYFIGVIMGYIIATYNPRDYRKVINRKWSKILLLTSKTMLIVIVCSGMILPSSYFPILAGVVVPLGRVCWGIGVCLLVGACEYGSLGKLTNSVGWRGFVPLSKLTFCLYLIHPFLMQKEKLPGNTLGVFNIFLMFKNGCGVVMLSCILSLIFYLIIEAPVVNISHSLLSDKSRQMENGEKPSDNGIMNNNNNDIKSKLS